MTTPETGVAEPVKAAGLRRGHLSAGRIAFFVIAAVAPLAGLAGAGPVIFASNGPAAPATFVFAGALFACFSVGYVSMSRHVTNAGGFVAYVARGFGVRVATATAYVTLLAYGAVQVALWTQFGVFVQQLVSSDLGIDIPSWIWTTAFLVAGTTVVARGVDVSIKVAGTLARRGGVDLDRLRACDGLPRLGGSCGFCCDRSA